MNTKETHNTSCHMTPVTNDIDGAICHGYTLTNKLNLFPIIISFTINILSGLVDG
jgi:hypothetical protein